MTDFASQHVGVPANPVTRVFNWIWNGLVSFAETGARAQEFKRLSEISDAEFAARGMTRGEAAQRVFARRFYI